MPQAIIDMNRVVEVSEAEEVTGHPFSLALTAADRVHFLKGTSREESKWWFDILSMFPRTNMKVHTRPSISISHARDRFPFSSAPLPNFVFVSLSPVASISIHLVIPHISLL